MIWKGAVEAHTAWIERAQHKFLIWLLNISQISNFRFTNFSFLSDTLSGYSPSTSYENLLHHFMLPSLKPRRMQHDIIFIRNISGSKSTLLIFLPVLHYMFTFVCLFVGWGSKARRRLGHFAPICSHSVYRRPYQLFIEPSTGVNTVQVFRRDYIPGVSEKSDEFKSCIFRVVLGIECRIGYQVKACSKIFCLSGNPPHLLRRAGHNS